MKQKTFLPLDDLQLRKSFYTAALITLILPPFFGGTLMGLTGFYPLPEFYYIFFNISGIYVAIVTIAVMYSVPGACKIITDLTQIEGNIRIKTMFNRLPWYLLLAVTVYSIFGALSADLSLENMGYASYTIEDHILHQLGIIPVVMITTFPVFFYFIDRCGRYLGPRGIHINAVPLWVKILMLGILTPLLIDSLLIGYYYNRTGFFHTETFILWISLIALASGGTWLAWRSIKQGLHPLERFTNINEGSEKLQNPSSLVPLSLDELGMLTARFAELTSNLERERDFANNIISTAPVIVLLLDKKGFIQIVNPCFEKLTGYTLNEIRGKEWFSTFLPERDRNNIRELFHKAMHNSQTKGNINSILNRNGDEVYIEWFDQTIRDENGQVTSLLAIGQDITERLKYMEELKQKEKDLKNLNESLEEKVLERTREVRRQNIRNESILNTTPDGFFAADINGKLIDANPAFCSMLGYTKDEISTLYLPDIEANENAKEVEAHIQKILRDKHDRFDTKHRRKDGSTFDVEISTNLVELEGNQFFYAFARDITARKDAEETIKQARFEAERANTAKSSFLSRMSHELRTPLNAILGFSRILETETDHPPSEEQKEYIDEIKQAGFHLLELVNEVLDLSRIESGRLTLNLERVEVLTLAESCISQIQPMASQKNIRVFLEIESGCSTIADRIRLKEVFLNLLSNAVKYNRKDGEIHVSCEVLDSGRIRINIKDTGPGIQKKDLHLLFKPFERLGSAYDGIEGTGIGLALSKKLVEGMQGSIGVNSAVGEGSTFWFELPK